MSSPTLSGSSATRPTRTALSRSRQMRRTGISQETYHWPKVRNAAIASRRSRSRTSRKPQPRFRLSLPQARAAIHPDQRDQRSKVAKGLLWLTFATALDSASAGTAPLRSWFAGTRAGLEERGNYVGASRRAQASVSARPDQAVALRR